MEADTGGNEGFRTRYTTQREFDLKDLLFVLYENWTWVKIVAHKLKEI
jgi:hypothetical protein